MLLEIPNNATGYAFLSYVDICVDYMRCGKTKKRRDAKCEVISEILICRAMGFEDEVCIALCMSQNRCAVPRTTTIPCNPQYTPLTVVEKEKCATCVFSIYMFYKIKSADTKTPNA